jgi:hypothetical protein
MSDSAQKRAERLRKALRENLKRRKAANDGGAEDAMARRADRLEPRLPQRQKDMKPDNSGRD